MEKSELYSNYKEQAYKLLVKLDRPSIKDVRTRLCHRYGCPLDKCDKLFKHSKEQPCEHVIKVNHLIERILEITDEY